MANLHYFNPWHDLALANGDANYQPPAAACMMETDLALLPIWYAGTGDVVRCIQPVPEEWLKKERMRLQVAPEWKFFSGEATGTYESVIPWGWDAALLKALRSLGPVITDLPGTVLLDEIRRFSHRDFAVFFGGELRSRLSGFSGRLCGTPEILDSYSGVVRFVGSHDRSVLKMPWSGSGRGLCWCHGQMNKPAEQWIRQALRRQKTLIGEPVYDKVTDFAMEFYSDGRGEVEFEGYSLFYTDSWGTYRGNRLAADEEIEKALSVYLPPELLHAVREQTFSLLKQQVSSQYEGPVGVDMMICRSTDVPFFRLHPCVEMNFRQTMGLVARRFYDRYVASGRSGRFCVDYYRKAGDLLKDHEQRIARLPLTIETGKITNGYLALAPVEWNSRCRVRVEIE